VEGSLHAAAEVFNTTEAQTAAVVAGIAQQGSVGGVAIANHQSSVNDAKNGHGGLCRSSTDKSQSGQRNEGSFHIKLLQG
jgi:hypothetical protein